MKSEKQDRSPKRKKNSKKENIPLPAGVDLTPATMAEFLAAGSSYLGSSYLDELSLAPDATMQFSDFGSGVASFLPEKAWDSAAILSSQAYDMASTLQKEIVVLREKLKHLVGELNEENRMRTNVESKYKIQRAKLKRIEKLQLILGRVHANAMDTLANNDELLKKFDASEPTEMAVLSVDIRKSTELMLSSKDPKLYADFLINLSRSMTSIVMNNYGVFDNFTGDGILALFPVFFSGDEAVQHAVNAAALCHIAFDEHYKGARSNFYTVKADAGLGIGIDFGNALLTSVINDLTAVGRPIVFACRLADSANRCTLLNESARQRLLDFDVPGCELEETSAEFKHQGPILCYKAMVNLQKMNPKKPSWWPAEPA